MEIVLLLAALIGISVGLVVSVLSLVAPIQAVFFLLEPGVLYLSHTFQTQPRVKRVALKDFLPRAKKVAESSVQLLQSEGFELQDALCLEESDDDWTYVVVMRHPGTRDRALVRITMGGVTQPWVKDTYTEFRAELSDGRCVRTLNPALLPLFGGEPHATETLVKASLRVLWQSHRVVCGQQAAKAPEEDVPEDATSYLLRLMHEEHAHWLERGLVVEDERRGVLKLTYKGACLMSWGRLWPVSPVRRRLMSRAAQERLGVVPTNPYVFSGVAN